MQGESCRLSHAQQAGLEGESVYIMPWEPTNVEQDRLEKLARLKELEVECYPPRVERTHTTADAIAAYEAVEADGEAAEGIEVTVCGRVRRINIKGKLSFWHIEDGTGRVQLMVRKDNVGDETYALVKGKLIELDDFVQASGVMMRTRTGEASVQVYDLKLLSKAVSPLPLIKEKVEEDGTVTQFGAFTDVETRYRQRYADLAVNADVRDVFRKRAKTVRAIRDFFDGEGFLETETPILQPIYGGAAARPFVTHHNQLDQDLYLRISFELYLKRLLVGMYDAVYEIGRDFRNEGVSYKHNPEFTQVEFYKAYIDYYGVMDITERLVAYCAEQVTGGTMIMYQGDEINLAPPWKRWTMHDAIREVTGIDYKEYPIADDLRAAMKAKGYAAKIDAAWGQLIDDLLGEVEATLIQPTFIIDYPRDISPFAKMKPGDPTHTERFEFFIAGMEMGNAFTELNDPADQEARFLEMAETYADEADEATPLDEDYLRAMRYGMPPCGGWGMGVDRLTMLLTDQRSIRDVLLFPHMREQG